MNYILKKATVIDPESKHHKKVRDVLLKNGMLVKIASKIENTEDYTEISLPNLHISQGWFDSSVSFGEPGFEERETLENGILTASQSGFTHVCINPNTHPIPDTKSGIEYIKTKGENRPVTLLPIGALTINSNGKHLAEVYDMHRHGAVAFYDYKQPVTHPNLLKIALQYCQTFNGLVQSFPCEESLAGKAQVNEGIIATQLGLKGIPKLAEELQIARDLYILEYTGGRLHIPTVSTKKSVDLIKKAKKKGLEVTCSVSINNLLLTDDALTHFDTHMKLQPPLRPEKDRKALIKALANGVIDGVTSDHNPIDIEHKKTEFEHAYYGSIGLESCYGALQTVLPVEDVVEALTRLKSTFGIEKHPLEEGNKADITLFSPDVEWQFTENDILSTSKNSALLNRKLKGKVYGIFAKKKLVLNNKI